MPLVPLELPTSSNPGRYGADGAARLINCYPESRGKEGKISFPLYAADGLKLFSTLTDGAETRGMLALDTELLVVSARLLFSVDQSGTATAKGGIPGDGPVYMARNAAGQVAITADGNKFVYEGGVLSDITDSDLPPAETCDYIDGYILYSIRDGRFFYSAIGNAKSISALDFAEAEGSPDSLVRVYVSNRNIWLIGSETTEIWQDTGNATSPFQRSPGAFFEFGCASAASVVTLGDSVALVTDDLEVVLASTTGQRLRISNHAVERDIHALSDKTTIEGFSYHLRGHEFYVLSSASWTWVYDALTGAWHERESYQITRWRASYYARFAGKHIVGSNTGGTLYEIDPDTYDEAGDHLIMRVMVPLHAWPHPIRLNRLHVDTIPGQGLNSADAHDSDPQVALKTSKDGGITFGNERSAPTGKLGERTKAAKFNRLGVSKEDGFVLDLSMSSATIRGITGLSGDLNALSA